VTGERRVRILALLASSGTADVTTKHLCEVCREVTGMTGAGIMLMSGDIAWGSLCTTDPVSALIEELQYALGEGPCLDACRYDRPVLEPDLADPATIRWPAFAGPVIDAGVRAIFGFPLQIGAVRLGALNLHCVRPGPLTDEQHADALVAADVVAQAILVLQANAPPGTLAAELETGADFQYVVHQAAGMVAVQLGVSVGHAIIRIKAHAFGNERSLTEVAREIVAKRLRFDPRSGGRSAAL
jgi:GAF domain-containing protein